MKKERLGILFISKLPPVNFTLNDAYFALPNWLSENSDLHLLCPKPPRNRRISFEGKLAQLIHFKPDLFHLFKLFGKVHRLLRSGKIDAIMTGVDEVSLLPGILLSRIHRIPVTSVCEDHPFWSRYRHPKTFSRTLEEKIRTFLLRKSLSRTARILCFIEGDVLNYLALPKEKIVQLTNGVHDSMLDRPPEAVFDQPLKIGYLGSIEKDKGALEMLEVLRIIRSQGIDAGMILIGNFYTAEEEAYFEAKRRQLGLMEAARVTGYLNHEMALRMIGECTVCLHAYRPLPWLYYNQVLKVGEYMARGKAVVSWDYPGVRRLLEDGRAGMLIKPGDLEAMAQGVKSILLDSGLRGDFERQAREVVKEKRVWSKIGRQAYRALQETMPERGQEPFGQEGTSVPAEE